MAGVPRGACCVGAWWAQLASPGCSPNPIGQGETDCPGWRCKLLCQRAWPESFGRSAGFFCLMPKCLSGCQLRATLSLFLLCMVREAAAGRLLWETIFMTRVSLRVLVFCPFAIAMRAPNWTDWRAKWASGPRRGKVWMEEAQQPPF